MNPEHARPQDYAMYYAGTYMRHKHFGPLEVMVDRKIGGGYDLRVRLVAGQHMIVPPDSLSCWWPRSTSCNTAVGALYVSRKAVRNMRKSAVLGSNYVVTYPKGYYHVGGELAALNKPNFVPLNQAREYAEEMRVRTVAISKDIIVGIHPDYFDVVFRGNLVGSLHDDGFRPRNAEDPLVKRTWFKLAREGIVQ